MFGDELVLNRLEVVKVLLGLMTEVVSYPIYLVLSKFVGLVLEKLKKFLLVTISCVILSMSSSCLSSIQRFSLFEFI